MEKLYYTYMLRCENNSIYTGITTDIERRMNEHFSKDEKCAKYTKLHTAKELLAYWKSENRVLASRLEFHLKKNLTKQQKEDIVKNNEYLEKYLSEKIDIENYKRIK